MSKLRRNKENHVRPSTDYNNNSNSNSKYGERKVTQTKVMPHDEFIKRVKKSLYYGSSQLSIPLSDYMTDRFSETHKGYSLNRLSYDTVGQLNTTPYSIILALIYLERLKDTDPTYTKHITPTELFLVSMLVSTKFYNGYDEDVSLSDWAEYGNLTNDQLKKIELEFLSALNWNVYVSNEQFFEKLDSIEAVLAKKQGLHRGWFTYVELNHLLPPIALAKSLIQYSLVLAMSYAAFVATIAGSIFLASQVPGTSLYASTHSSSTSMDNGLIHGETDRTKADRTTALDSDEAEQEAMLEATMDLLEADDVPCGLVFDRLRDSMNATNIRAVNLPSFAYQDKYPLLGTLPDRSTVLDDSDDIGIRTGFNLRRFLFGNDVELQEKRNFTGYEWLMMGDRHHINTELSSCSKNDFGLAFQWRKYL